MDAAPAQEDAGGESGFARARQILILVVVWWSSAAVVVLALKRTVGSKGAVADPEHYPYPFALTCLVNTCCGLVAFVISRCSWVNKGNLDVPTLRRDEALKLCFIGTIQGVEIGCNNKALEYLPVSTRTMILSLNVIFMMATTWFWGLEPIGCLKLVVVAIIAVGGMIQGYGDGASSASSGASTLRFGVGLMFVSMCIGSQRWALLQFILQQSDEASAFKRMSKLQLTSRTLPITGFVCLVLAGIFEREAFDADAVLQTSLLGRVLLIGCGIAALTVAELHLVQMTSALAFQVVSTLHQIPIVVAGILLFREEVHASTFVGFGFCLVGSLFYAGVRSRDSPEQSPSDTQDLMPRESELQRLAATSIPERATESEGGSSHRLSPRAEKVEGLPAPGVYGARLEHDGCC